MASESLVGSSSSGSYGSTFSSSSSAALPLAAAAGAAYEMADETEGKPAAGSGLPLSTFNAYLAWRSSRAKVLRQVPCSLFMYILFVSGILLRARIATSYEFESQLLTSVVYAGDGFAPSSATEWFVANYIEAIVR